METENELNGKIIRLIRKIREEHPELTKYLDEMPMTIPNDVHPDITLAKLKEYYEALNLLMQENA